MEQTGTMLTEAIIQKIEAEAGKYPTRRAAGKVSFAPRPGRVWLDQRGRSQGGCGSTWSRAYRGIRSRHVL